MRQEQKTSGIDGKTDGNHTRHSALQDDTQEQRKRTIRGEKGTGLAGGSGGRAGKRGKVALCSTISHNTHSHSVLSGCSLSEIGEGVGILRRLCVESIGGMKTLIPPATDPSLRTTGSRWITASFARPACRCVPSGCLIVASVIPIGTWRHQICRSIIA